MVGGTSASDGDRWGYVMASTPKLSIGTLTKLGARKLAELLLAEASRNRQLKQTLNLAISARDGPATSAQACASASRHSAAQIPCSPMSEAAN